MAENKRWLPPMEPLNQIHNPSRWGELFLTFAIKRCWPLWSNIGIPPEFNNNPLILSDWAVEYLQKEKSFCDNCMGTKQEFIYKWADYWETIHRDFFSKVIRQYGLDNANQLYHWCYWQGGIGFPLQFANKQYRNSTRSILRAWGCVITELVYNYSAQDNCDEQLFPSLPPEISDWMEAAEDLLNLEDLPKKAPEFQEPRSMDDNCLPYSPLMLPNETVNLIRQTMFNYYHPDPCIDDDRVDEMLANITKTPLSSRELELLKYIGTEYSLDEQCAPPRYVEKYIDLDLVLETLFRNQRIYSVVVDLEKLLKESEKKALIDWARMAVVRPPFGNANVLVWPSEVDEKV